MKGQSHAVERQLTVRERRDLAILARFTAVFCRCHHPGERRPVAAEWMALAGLKLEKYPVCDDCRGFLEYAFERRLRCPLEEKPSCKHCTIHCYRPGHRERVREIMKFSGRHLILRGRLDLLWHYWF